MGMGHQGQKPSLRPSERGRLQPQRELVVVVDFDSSHFVKGARGENPFPAGIRPRKAGGFVPVEVTDRARIFRIGLGHLASEDVRLPSSSSQPAEI